VRVGCCCGGPAVVAPPANEDVGRWAYRDVAPSYRLPVVIACGAAMAVVLGAGMLLGAGLAGMVAAAC
jgi:hypothetical protein